MPKPIIFVIILFPFLSCNSQVETRRNDVIPGAEQMHLYLPLLKNKMVGIVANHTSRVKNSHLVDTLLNSNVNIAKIFALEHGFRGDADAGQQLEDGIDSRTGIPIVSLYGKDYKPTPSDLEGIDVLLFDIQDVGVRFYTYLSSLHYVLEASSENKVLLIVLDRPNPNGFYVDGPILDTVYQSFVGLHPIPIVHGMTLGELANMMIGENWINQANHAELNVILCKNYSHDSIVNITINPSPNLQSMKAIYLYPTLGLFEGTIMSVGRGTDFPFLVFGHPVFPEGNIKFTPRSIPGISTHPKFKGRECQGVLLNDYPMEYLINQPGIHLEWIILAYERMGKPEDFFNSFFLNLSGNKSLKQKIANGWSAEKIKKTWEPGLNEFKIMRKKYLLYNDFQ
jgi:uncharacterized protein YbbC (DUF1343 family)